MILRKHSDYPYVVVRWMATVYQRLSVKFSSDTSHKNRKVFHVLWHSKINKSEPIPPSALDALIEAVTKASRVSGFRMCIVLSENDALYVEPDGKIRRQSQPPSGGVSL